MTMPSRVRVDDAVKIGSSLPWPLFFFQFLNSCLENTLQIHARVYKLQKDNRVPGTDSKLQFQGLAAARRSRVVLFEKYEAASTALTTRA